MTRDDERIEQAKRMARELGRRGGAQTAKNRTKQQRSEAARRAAEARWKKK